MQKLIVLLGITLLFALLSPKAYIISFSATGNYSFSFVPKQEGEPEFPEELLVDGPNDGRVSLSYAWNVPTGSVEINSTWGIRVNFTAPNDSPDINPFIVYAIEIKFNASYAERLEVNVTIRNDSSSLLTRHYVSKNFLESKVLRLNLTLDGNDNVHPFYVERGTKFSVIIKINPPIKIYYLEGLGTEDNEFYKSDEETASAPGKFLVRVWLTNETTPAFYPEILGVSHTPEEPDETTPITVRLNFSNMGVGPYKAVIYYKVGSMETVKTDMWYVSTADDYSFFTFEGTIPNDHFVYNTIVSYAVVVWDYLMYYTMKPDGAVNVPTDTFLNGYEITIADGYPPILKDLKLSPYPPIDGQQLTVTITAYDNGTGINESAVYVHCRINNQQWETRQMYKSEPLKNEFSVNLGIFSMGTKIEMYFEARDLVNHTAYLFSKEQPYMCIVQPSGSTITGMILIGVLVAGFVLVGVYVYKHHKKIKEAKEEFWKRV